MPKRCFSHSKTQWKNGEFRPPLFPLVFALGGVRLGRPQNDDFRPGSTTKQPEISGLRGRCHPQVLRASYEDPRGDSAPQTLKLGVRRPFTHKKKGNIGGENLPQHEGLVGRAPNEVNVSFTGQFPAKLIPGASGLA